MKKVLILSSVGSLLVSLSMSLSHSLSAARQADIAQILLDPAGKEILPETVPIKNARHRRGPDQIAVAILHKAPSGKLKVELDSARANADLPRMHSLKETGVSKPEAHTVKKILEDAGYKLTQGHDTLVKISNLPFVTLMQDAEDPFGPHTLLSSAHMVLEEVNTQGDEVQMTRVYLIPRRFVQEIRPLDQRKQHSIEALRGHHDGRLVTGFLKPSGRDQQIRVCQLIAKLLPPGAQPPQAQNAQR